MFFFLYKKIYSIGIYALNHCISNDVYRYGGFIIDEAEVDDEVDEDDEWEDGANELGIVNEVDEIGPTAREIEIRRRGNWFE